MTRVPTSFLERLWLSPLAFRFSSSLPRTLISVVQYMIPASLSSSLCRRPKLARRRAATGKRSKESLTLLLIEVVALLPTTTSFPALPSLPPQRHPEPAQLGVSSCLAVPVLKDPQAALTSRSLWIPRRPLFSRASPLPLALSASSITLSDAPPSVVSRAFWKRSR